MAKKPPVDPNKNYINTWRPEFWDRANQKKKNLEEALRQPKTPTAKPKVESAADYDRRIRGLPPVSSRAQNFDRATEAKRNATKIKYPK